MPIPAQTPYEKYNGDLPAAQRAGGTFRKALQANLPPRLRDRLQEFPWLSVPE